MENSKLKSGTLNAIGSFSYSCLSLFFMVVITRINGLEQAGVFSLLYALVNLVYNIGVYSGRTYHVSDHSKGITDKDYLYQRILTTALMAIVGLAVCIVNEKYRMDMMMALLLITIRCLDSISEVFYGMMQKHYHLDQVGISMTMKTAGVVLAFTVADFITRNVYVSFAGALAVIVLEMVVYEYKNISCYLRTDAKVENVIRIFKSGIYACLLAVFVNYLTSAPKYALAEYVSSEKQAVFNIIFMPATVIVLCAYFIVQPFIVDMSKHYQEQDMKSFSKCLNLCLLACFGIGCISIVGGYFFGVPFLNALYGADVTDYKLDFLIVLFGAILLGMFQIMSAAFTIMNRTKMLMIVTGITSAITWIASKVLTKIFGFRGGSLSFVVTNFVVFFICLFVYYRNQNSY